MKDEVVSANQWLENYHEFHGYKILRTGVILSKKGKPMKMSLRPRRGGKADLCIHLQIEGNSIKFTCSRLIAACFIGSVYGYEVNHKDRDPMNIHVDNLEIGTRSQNQQHWRKLDEQLGK